MDNPEMKPDAAVVAQPRGRPFGRGRSGNPSGRPKGARNKATMAAEILLEGELETLTRTAIEKAKQGDIAALRLCLDRICPPRRDRVVNFDMPDIASVQDAAPAASAVLKACAAGQISPGEAMDIMNLISNFLRVIETSTLDSRLAALETALETVPWAFEDFVGGLSDWRKILKRFSDVAACQSLLRPARRKIEILGSPAFESSN